MRIEVANELHRLAGEDARVVFVGSDQGAGSMSAFRESFPSRFFMEGISEQYVVGMAAGLATTGFIPFVQAIATFLTRRAYEQIHIDLGLQNLPVRIIGSSAGLTHSALGPTHTAIDDIALMRNVPNMTVVSPRDGAEAAHWLRTLKDHPGPVYVRLVQDAPCGAELPRGNDAVQLVSGDGPLLVVATGAMTHAAADACAAIGLGTTLLHVPVIHPLKSALLLEKAAQARAVMVVEEHLAVGGLGSAVLEALSCAGLHRPVRRLGVSHRPTLAYGTAAEARAAHGLSGPTLVAALAEAVGAWAQQDEDESG